MGFCARLPTNFGAGRGMANIFEGRYQQFGDIATSDDYNDLNIVEQVYQHTFSRYKSNAFFPAPIPGEYNHIRDLTSLCISMLCANTNDDVNILDIGGGFGASYVELIKRCQLKNIRYTVCEIENVARYYQSHSFLTADKIQILSAFENIKGPYQFIIFGSSLQYFSDYEGTLREVIQRSQHPEYILVTHTPVTMLPSFVTAQINMGNKKIPNRIFNIDTLIQSFSDQHYQCIFKSAIFREGLFDDFGEASAQFRSANLLFKAVA